VVHRHIIQESHQISMQISSFHLLGTLSQGVKEGGLKQNILEYLNILYYLGEKA
jgi:hypothetical protein